MGEIVEFNVGCRRCEHLIQVDKNTYICEVRSHLDDSTVFPIVNGKINDDDWDACEGEDYSYRVVDKRKRRKSS